MSDTPDNQVDSILAFALSEKLDGREPDIEALVKEYPQFSNEIRTRWKEIHKLDSYLVSSNRCVEIQENSLVGQTIRGYHILAEIGRGGMGIVYRAEQQEPRRTVALKVVRGDYHTDEHMIHLFRREIRALALLQHPNIASIYSADTTTDGRHFFVMELVDGEPLLSFVNRMEFSIRQKLDLFCDVCNAVAYAHQRGVIHRDIKPQNILAAKDGSVKVLDFGLARIETVESTNETRFHSVARVQGTLPYMSPEQVSGDPRAIDVRTDVYALGLLLYELLSNTQPFNINGMSLRDSLRTICEESPVRLSKIEKVFCGDLDTIVSKAITKQADQRYQTVQELHNDIQLFLEYRPITARPSTIRIRVARVIRRRPIHVALVVAVLALCVSGYFVVDSMVASAAQAEVKKISKLKESFIITITPGVPWHTLCPTYRDLALAELENAETKCREILSIDNNDIWALLQMARVKFISPDSAHHAIFYVNRAIEVRPDFVSPLLFRRLAETKDRIDEVQIQWKPEWTPIDPIDIYFCGVAASLLGERTRAFELYSAYLRAKPTDHTVILERVRNTSFPGTDIDRLREYESAVLLYPNWPEGLKWLAGAQYSCNQWSALDDTITRLIDLDANTAVTTASMCCSLTKLFSPLNRIPKLEQYVIAAAENDMTGDRASDAAKLYFHAGKPAEALVWIDTAILRSPQDYRPNHIVEKATMLVDTGKTMDAISLVRKAVIAYPESRMLVTKLALYEEQLGNYEEALQLLEEATHLKSNLPVEIDLYDGFCTRLLISQGRTSDAISLLKKRVIRMKDREDYSYVTDSTIIQDLGGLLWQEGRYREAHDLFLERIRRFPDYGHPRVDYARFLTHKKQFEAALNQAHQAVGLRAKLQSDAYGHTQNLIGGIHEHQGNLASAATHYRLAMLMNDDVSDHNNILSWAKTALKDWSPKQDRQYEQLLGSSISDDTPLQSRAREVVFVIEKMHSLLEISFQAHRVIGKAQNILGNREVAMQHYIRAFELACAPDVTTSKWFIDFDRPTLMEEMCILSYEIDGTTEIAAKWYRQAMISFTSGHARCGAILAYARILKKDGQLKAAEDVARAGLLSESGEVYDISDLWHLIGKIQEQRGDLNAAIASWEKAVETSYRMTLHPAAMDMFRVAQANIQVAPRGRTFFKNLLKTYQKYYEQEKLPLTLTDDMASLAALTAYFHCLLGEEDEAITAIEFWRQLVETELVPKAQSSQNLRIISLLASKSNLAAVLTRARELSDELDLNDDVNGVQ